MAKRPAVRKRTGLKQASVKVMLVDDVRAARTGLMLMLREDPGIIVVSQASNGAEAIDYLRLSPRELPDVILMDVRMPVMDGIKATGIIKHEFPSTKILILTTYDEDDYAFDGISRGASGFLLKDATAKELCAAIRAVFRGDAVLTPRMTSEFIKRDIRQVPDRENITMARISFRALSPREQEIAKLVAQGLSDAEIAEQLTLEPASVGRMLRRILVKMGVRDRIQIVITWYQAGLDQLAG